MSRETDLIKQLASLEAKMSTMQEQLAQLALALLSERSQRYEQRLSTLEALVQQTMGASPAPPILQQTDEAGAPVASPHPERRMLYGLRTSSVGGSSDIVGRSEPLQEE